MPGLQLAHYQQGKPRPWVRLLHPASVGTFTGAALAASGRPPISGVSVPGRLYWLLVGFALGWGVTKSLDWLRWKCLKRLLTYQGWIYNQKSTKTKVRKVRMLLFSTIIAKRHSQQYILVFSNFGSRKLTPNVRGPSYLGLTRSISWLLIPWLLTSPGHQQPWYWLCRICRSFSYLRNDFKYLCHIDVEEWHKM